MFTARSNRLRTIRCKIATLTPCEVGNNVRFAPSSGLSHSVAPLPKCANTGSDAQPISAVAPLRVAIRGIGNRGVAEVDLAARPETERLSHYFRARLPDQFEAVLHFEETRAVEPLERSAGWEAGEVPETFPFAV